MKAGDVIKLQQLRLLFEFLKNLLPTELYKLFKLNENVHNHETRQTFHVPTINTSTYGNNSIKFRCPELWNTMFKNGIAVDRIIKNNVNFEQIQNIYQFKRILKKHFLFSYSL